MSSYTFINIKKLKLRPLLNKINKLKNKKVYDGIFYKVENNEGYFYLGGSIHLGNNKKVCFNSAVEEAYMNSTKLAVELDITKFKNKIDYLKCLANTPTVKIPTNNENFEPDFLQSENTIKYKNLCKELGLNFEKCSKYPPKTFYSILHQRLMKKYGYKSIYGIDLMFINRAKHDKKEVVSLETSCTQVNALIAAANLSPECLGDTSIKNLKDLETSMKLLSKMHNAIFEGDALTLVNDILTYKPLNESDKNNLNTLLFERNENMANKIESLIKSQEIYFVIVGASHVIGKGGLLKLFKDKGYKISRLK
ncbi:TraB/GumN family protein [Clostridium sp. P21]|uniref:TraB/GumN family protein n=1 Tax=Clostridium muellerianum TaxID=2716538 RepID=A0A7Y0EJF9_9CLOT|nr:TraB/GumN family protein [Clostridium muellerianum]NMM64580.1 TraB/GumN family protein [Clostridium muellerianum]